MDLLKAEPSFHKLSEALYFARSSTMSGYCGDATSVV